MAVVGATSAAPPRFEPALMRRRVTGTIFYGIALLSISILMLTLLLILADVLVKGLPWLDWDFLTSYPSRRPERAGILPALIGSIQIIILVAILTFPTGVAAAIYFVEYASDRRLNRLLQTNIGNLAGVPSIIYGIFGLALFVRFLSLGPTILSGALTLTLLILPIVIIASIEALKAVPEAQREGAYALGASRWQMVKGSVVPAAAPGIMTGIILGIARAIGETAPLILVGAATFVSFIPQPFSGGFTVLPIQAFDWATRPQAAFQGITSATIIVILFLIFVLNLLALVIRARLSRHIQW